MIDRYGADALRWYFFTSKQPWDGYRFSLDTIAEAVRQFLLQLWNTYGFYVLYANANGIDREPRPAGESATELDRWALSRLQATIEFVRDRMDNFDATECRPRDPVVRRRDLELVRAPLAPALLGRRSGRVRDAPRPAC